MVAKAFRSGSEQKLIFKNYKIFLKNLKNIHLNFLTKARISPLLAIFQNFLGFYYTTQGTRVITANTATKNIESGWNIYLRKEPKQKCQTDSKNLWAAKIAACLTQKASLQSCVGQQAVDVRLGLRVACTQILSRSSSRCCGAATFRAAPAVRDPEAYFGYKQKTQTPATDTKIFNFELYNLPVFINCLLIKFLKITFFFINWTDFNYITRTRFSFLLS